MRLYDMSYSDYIIQTCTCTCIHLHIHVHINLAVPLLQASGAPFVINGKTCHFRGTVTIVSADNPASASLGGFKQSGSAFRFCRHCMGTEDDIQTKVNVQCTFSCTLYMLDIHVCMRMYSTEYVKLGIHTSENSPL